MNELSKNKLETLANDELLLKAIKEVFDGVIENEKPKVGEIDDNIRLGEKFRAYELSKQIIEKGFIDLMSYQINKKPIKSFHKER